MNPALLDPNWEPSPEEVQLEVLDESKLRLQMSWPN
jgi:hypothetical protein